ncbi:DUF393 domain-containing protein [Aureimonas sp. ME7]|uniref:thiol-disulfide oxidoreductase DCC family protein n=1 Tax=Aureimonas sp. ME7 TaxID=2744252 RepID=UPI001FCEC664|nr:DUF393 domain-containing protein [Aureimonas sp. ME7]
MRAAFDGARNVSPRVLAEFGDPDIDAGTNTREHDARRDLPHAAGRDFGMRVHHLFAMEELTVWYDGACPLCRREIALVRRLDRRGSIRFVDASRGETTGCPVNRGDLLAHFHASENGRLVSGAEAFAAMWRAVPLLRPLGMAASHPAALALLERVYRAFLRVRPALQRVARRLDRP